MSYDTSQLESLLPKIDSSEFSVEEKAEISSWLQKIISLIKSSELNDDMLAVIHDMVVSPPEVVAEGRYSPLFQTVFTTLFSMTDALDNIVMGKSEHTPEPGVDPQPFVGHHLLADFYGCKGDLEDEKTLKETISLAIEAAEMDEIKIDLVHFKPYGITAFAIISQSAIGIHTWPESGDMLVDAVTCGPHDPHRIIETLKEVYQPERVDEKMIERGEGGDMAKEEQDVAPAPVRFPDKETKVKGPGVEVKPCEHGHGVFATQDFGKDELIESFTGSFLMEQEGSGSKEKALRVDDLLWYEPRAGDDEVWAIFLDHSEEPNAIFDNFDFDAGTGDLLTLRPIKAGEEILINYGDYAPDKEGIK